jgi:glycosyltransferase involved in cell wall biosynthesis
MRLQFVIKALSLQGGGAERVLCEICSELAERGHSVEIISFDQPRSVDFYPLDQRVGRIRLGIGRIDAPSGIGEFARRVRALRSLLLAKRPDVAVGFMHSGFVTLAVAGLATGIPVIASEHTVYDHYRERPLEKLLIRAIAPLCTAFTITLENVRRGFPGAIAGRMTVIPDPVMLRPQPPEPRDHDRQRLLFVANFRPEKRHRALISAFGLVAAENPTWDLRLVGEGELRLEVERQVRNLGLQSRISFAGAVADVSREYAAADLFVVPSAYESFGLATAEALASGLPVVGFADCPATSQLVQDGCNGILVRGPDRARALAQSLRRLMSSIELRKSLGRSGPASVQGYSIKSVVDKWEQLLRSVGLP